MQIAARSSFVHHTERLCPAIDAALDAASRLDAGCPAQLREAMRYSLLAPGKRLRPVLVLLAAEACGGAVAAALPAACAAEMVHAYSLIHDDLPAMDDDDLRRGRPTCHRVFGEALAILAGDGLLALAFETLAKGDLSPQATVRCCALLAEAAGPCHLVGGQVDDMVAPGKESPELTHLESIHARKTGALILASLRLGGFAAGASESQISALEEYGARLGLAFQITDDLLDVRSDEASTGKRVGKDAALGKLTFPGMLGVQGSQEYAERLIHEAQLALTPLGSRADGLASVATYVLERNH